jgi:two-component system response regulator VicR
MNPSILVIDDDPTQLALLRLELGREGYDMATAKSGREGLRKAYQVRPELIILDVLMPDMDGLVVLRRLRQVCDAPIMMLTALSSKADIVKGLSLGADGYVTKPYSFGELKARIHSLMRRGREPDTSERHAYDDGYLRIDLQEAIVMREGERIELTPTESQLLMRLVSQKGKIIPRKVLLASVWGKEYTDATNSLSTYIRYLRRKLEDDPSRPRYIHTRRGLGYYFAAKKAG